MFIVIAHRGGDREKHSYLVGAFELENKAEMVAEAEECWRAGKYKCEIYECVINSFPSSKLKHWIECTKGI